MLETALLARPAETLPLVMAIVLTRLATSANVTSLAVTACSGRK
jgi:hypothetical protein